MNTNKNELIEDYRRWLDMQDLNWMIIEGLVAQLIAFIEENLT